MPWDSLGAEAGIPDLSEFQACVESERHIERVESDRALAEALGIPGTPGFIVNGKRLQGVQPIEEFERLLRRQ